MKVTNVKILVDPHGCYGFKLVSGKASYDLPISFNIEPDVPYHLLYCIYDTGDTFTSWEDLIEFVGLYKDENKAKENKQRIEHHNEPYNKYKKFWVDEYDLMLVDDDWKEYKISAPWKGYFEHLQLAIIIPITIITNDKGWTIPETRGRMTSREEWND